MHTPFRAAGALLGLALMLVPGSFPAIAATTDDVDSLARDVQRLTSLREVKDVQRQYAHLAQYGRWQEMAGLFTADARFTQGKESVTGRTAIARWLKANHGGGRDGLPARALNTEFIDEPLANLSVDGRTAKVRWMSMAFRGDGRGKATIEGGIYENEYVREAQGWKISVSHYHAQYSGTLRGRLEQHRRRRSAARALSLHGGRKWRARSRAGGRGAGQR